MPWAGSGLGGALVQHGGSIDTREELVGALAVAAELDHFLLAQYLFAAYSMKKRPSEGISERQVELARRWEGVLLAVAREEVAHLAIVVNLSTAVGMPPTSTDRTFRSAPVPSIPSTCGSSASAWRRSGGACASSSQPTPSLSHSGWRSPRTPSSSRSWVTSTDRSALAWRRS